jgi:hypothetical protein
VGGWWAHRQVKLIEETKAMFDDDGDDDDDDDDSSLG